MIQKNTKNREISKHNWTTDDRIIGVIAISYLQKYWIELLNSADVIETR